MTRGEEVLRRLTIGDTAYCRAMLAVEPVDSSLSLDARNVAMLRLGSAIADGSAAPLLRQSVQSTLAVGVSFDQIVGALLALAPTIGIERTVTVAPALAAALDYDVDRALEELDELEGPDEIT